MGGIGAFLYNRVSSSTGITFPTSPLAIVGDPALLGGLVAVVVLVWSVTTFVRVHKRHGLATTFGVVRQRGQKIRMLRYANVARCERRKVHANRSFLVLELKTKDGATMTTYATRLMDTIEAGAKANASS